MAVEMRKAAETLKENAKVVREAMEEAARMLEEAAKIVEQATEGEQKGKAKVTSKAKDDGSKGNEKPVGGTDRVWY